VDDCAPVPFAAVSTEDATRGIDRSPKPTGMGGAASTGTQKKLTLSVQHGDLRYCGLPVIVGSYDGTPIRGAERAVDEHLDGAVRRRSALRRLHGAAGTCELFIARKTKEPTAMVVGLGNPGDLTPGLLTDLTTQAVLRFAAERLDRLPPAAAGADVHRETVAAVLIGTTGQAPLTVASSIGALVAGTQRANRVLADQDHSLRIGELRIVEVYEERAIEAQHMAGRLCQELGRDHEGLHVESRVLDGYAGCPGAPLLSYEEGAWRTLRIVGMEPAAGAESVELSFTSVGRAARAEQQVTLAQRQLVEGLVAETVRSPDVNKQLCNTLYELLVPNAMKGQTRANENLMCVVDEHSAALPLEMLARRGDADEIIPLVVGAGVVRRLETRSYRERVRAASGNHALVIADPPGTGQPQLDGARLEARAVVKALQDNGYDVTTVIPDEKDDGRTQIPRILNALFAHEYRIVHIAGHGTHVDGSPASSGVLIGDGQILSALEVEKMSATPDLFFLNCCHLAGVQTTAARPDRLAATIGRQLIDIGVRAVVAAGWAVNDQAATLFATTLYTELLGDNDLGTASCAARKAVRDDYTEFNTWGAYQVYGPPSFRLVSFQRGPKKDAPPVAPREFRDALDRIARLADSADYHGDCAAELTTLLDKVPPQWLDREFDRVGAIWMALGHYDRAMQVLGRARESWSGQTSLRSLEHLVNVQVKYASEMLATNPDDAGAVGILTNAEENLQALLRVQDTPERRCLLGSLYRRRAQFPARGPVRAVLESALKEYGAAEQLQAKRQVVDPYATLNRVVVGWLLSFHGGPAPDTVESMATIEGCAAAAGGSPHPDFWYRVTPADCMLIRALVEGRLTDPDDRDAVAHEYEAVITARSTRRERLTVVEHLEVLERCLPADGADDQAAKTRRALADLRERLRALVDGGQTRPSATTASNAFRAAISTGSQTGEKGGA